jgi:CheY-like chemotaxis protein
MQREPIRELLVEDDEEDFLFLRDLFSKVGGQRFRLHRVSTYDAGLEAARRSHYDVYLLNYCLDEHNGLELLRELDRDGRGVPVILLTADGDRALRRCLDDTIRQRKGHRYSGLLAPVGINPSLSTSPFSIA